MIFLPARRCASADTSYGPAAQVGVLSKRLNESGWFLPRELPNTYPTVCYQKIHVLRTSKPTFLPWSLFDYICLITSYSI